MSFLIRATAAWSVVLVCCFLAVPPSSADPSAEAEIRKALEDWSAHFNAGDKRAACVLFAPDLVAIYPGVAD